MSTKEFIAAIILLTGLLLFFLSLPFSMYVDSYNRAMINCLAEHSKDVCVETLR